MTALLRFFGWAPKPKADGIKNAHYLAVHVANAQNTSAMR